MENRKRSKGRNRLVLGACGVVALTVLFGSFWWSAPEADPKVSIPTPVMPSPNAYDAYVQAAQSLKPIRWNGQTVGIILNFDRRGMVPIYPPAEKIAFVKANATTLQNLRAGFAYDFWFPPVRTLNTDQSLFSMMGRFGKLMRLVLMDGEVKAASGDWYGALQSDLDILRTAQDLPRGAGIEMSWYSTYYQSLGKKAAWAAIDHLSAAQARQAARRLETIIARHVPFSDMMQEQKWQEQAELLAVFPDPGWRSKLIWGVNSQAAGRLVTDIQLRAVSKQATLDSVTRYFDRWIRLTRQPFAAHSPAPPLPENPLAGAMVLDYSQHWNLDVLTQSGNTALLLRLALRAYRLDHSRYPASLQELVPAYLSKLPDDPLALKGTFGYKRNEEKYTLSSNGSAANGK